MHSNVINLCASSVKGDYRFGYFFNWFVSPYICEPLLYTEENRVHLPSELHSNITADIYNPYNLVAMQEAGKELSRKLLEYYPGSLVQEGLLAEIISIVMEVSFMCRNI